MKIKFKKMHGAGNDFVVMTDSSALPKDLSTLAIAMCDRHFGIGADGHAVGEKCINIKTGKIFLAKFRKNLDGKHQGLDGFQAQQHDRFLGAANFAGKTEEDGIDHLQYFSRHA